MERAITLARQSHSEPDKVSPKVGAVVARDGVLIGEAFRGELAAGEHASSHCSRRSSPRRRSPARRCSRPWNLARCATTRSGPAWSGSSNGASRGSSSASSIPTSRSAAGRTPSSSSRDRGRSVRPGPDGADRRVEARVLARSREPTGSRSAPRRKPRIPPPAKSGPTATGSANRGRRQGRMDPRRRRAWRVVAAPAPPHASRSLTPTTSTGTRSGGTDTRAGGTGSVLGAEWHESLDT